MTGIQVKQKGKLIVSVFDKNDNIISQFPPIRAIDPVSGDEMLDFDAIDCKGLDCPEAYGLCMNYVYGKWTTGSIHTIFYEIGD